MKKLIDIINTDNEPNIINDMVFGDDNLKNNNMKQTAVEWLIERLSSSKYIYNLMEEIECQSTIVQPDIFEQAKAMEKEQIIDIDYRLSVIEDYAKGEAGDEITNLRKYINETFKNK
jgi:hypothetical protein